MIRALSTAREIANDGIGTYNTSIVYGILGACIRVYGTRYGLYSHVEKHAIGLYTLAVDAQQNIFEYVDDTVAEERYE